MGAILCRTRSKLPIFEIMRAYRLCAAISRAWSRSSAQLRSRVTTLALLGSLCVPPAVLADSGSTAATTAAGTPDSRPQLSLACYGILGEVARPGVYQLSTGCTLGQLVSCAGGLTGNANGNARVLRGARLAEQFFVAASEAAVLSPGDLIVAGGQASRLAEANGARAGRAPAQVQIGLLNLIERPVVLSLPRELASPARIVEYLGQSPELADACGIVGPSRAEVRASFSANFADDRLASGAVLIFPMHRVRAASLPPLPEPIPVLAQPQFVAAPSTPAGLATETAPAVDAPPTSIEAARYRGGRVAGFFLARRRVPNRSSATGQRGRTIPSTTRADDLRSGGPPRRANGRLPRAERLATGVGPRGALQRRTCSIAPLHIFLCDRRNGHLGDRVHDRLDGPAGIAQHSLAPTGDCGRAGAARTDVCRTHAGEPHPPRRCQPASNALALDLAVFEQAQARRRRERRRFRTTRRRPPELSQHVSGRGLSLSGTFERTCEPRCATLRPWAQLSFTTCAWRSCCWRWPARGWPTCSPCRAIG